MVDFQAYFSVRKSCQNSQTVKDRRILLVSSAFIISAFFQDPSCGKLMASNYSIEFTVGVLKTESLQTNENLVLLT